MELKDTFALFHPAIAIGFVFPLIGIAVNRAMLTRQRRLQTKSGEKSKIAPSVGSEHLAIGIIVNLLQIATKPTSDKSLKPMRGLRPCDQLFVVDSSKNCCKSIIQDIYSFIALTGSQHHAGLFCEIGTFFNCKSLSH